MLNLSKFQSQRAPARRIALIAALALGTSLTALSSAYANPMAQPPAPGGQQQQPAPEQNNEVQQILAKYGQFSKHEKYGDVWKPTQVAQGWRPYEPCHWVYNQEMKAWYFDDKTEWGNIVHHYGRWTLDAQQGWLWVPGADFSPGWVSWEMRGSEVGWAPLPPDQDAAMVATASFKNDPNLWIFVAFESLGKGCGAGAPPPPAPAPAYAPPPAYAPAPAYAPVPAPVVYGGGGGIYIPPRIVINHGCHHDRRWCHWHPPHWKPPHQRPPHDHRPPHGDRPHDNHTNCRASWCRPGGHHPGGHKPGDHRPGGHVNTGPKGPIQCIRAPCNLPGQHAGNGKRPPHFNNPLWRNPVPRQQMANRFTPNNRFVQRFNHQPRVNMAPRMSAPRMAMGGGRSFAPRMSAGPRMGGAGGMRFGGGGGRRR